MRPILAAVVAILVASPIAAQDRKRSDNEKLPGETWTYEGTKGELSRKGEFRVHGGRVYAVEKPLGTVSTKGDESILVVRGHSFLNGRIVLKRDGDALRGVMTAHDGSKWALVVTAKEAKPKEKREPKKEKKPV